MFDYGPLRTGGRCQCHLLPLKVLSPCLTMFDSCAASDDPDEDGADDDLDVSNDYEHDAVITTGNTQLQYTAMNFMSHVTHVQHLDRQLG